MEEHLRLYGAIKGQPAKALGRVRRGGEGRVKGGRGGVGERQAGVGEEETG